MYLFVSSFAYKLTNPDKIHSIFIYHRAVLVTGQRSLRNSLPRRKKDTKKTVTAKRAKGEDGK